MNDPLISSPAGVMAVPGAARNMGKGVLVMLLGRIGVVLGGFLAFAPGQSTTTPDTWPLHFPLPEDS